MIRIQNLKETSRPQKETGPETQMLLLLYVSDFRFFFFFFLSLSVSLWTSFIYFPVHIWKNPIAESYIVVHWRPEWQTTSVFLP